MDFTHTNKVNDELSKVEIAQLKTAQDGLSKTHKKFTDQIEKLKLLQKELEAKIKSLEQLNSHLTKDNDKLTEVLSLTREENTSLREKLATLQEYVDSLEVIEDTDDAPTPIDEGKGKRPKPKNRK